MTHCTKVVTGVSRGVFFLTVIGLVVLACSHPPGARADDLDLTISGQALERFFQAAAPFRFDYEVMSVKKAAEISLENPKVFLEPGQPGRVWVAFDYHGQSSILGLPPFSGRAKPEIKFDFVPEKGALRLTLKGLEIKAGMMTLRLDGLMEPLYLPLIPPDPVTLPDHMVEVKVTAARTEVVDQGLRILADYQFSRRPRP